MEDDIKKRWVLEYFLRQPIEDGVINRLITALSPLVLDDSLMKTLLVRKISSQVNKGLISETILLALELIEELDNRMGIRILNSMKQAYCAVAVDCTVKFLKENPKNYSGYDNMIGKIWRGRVLDMERAKDVDLVSDWSKDLRTKLEEVMHNVTVCGDISEKDTRNDALKWVKEFLEEVTEEMGPSFLDLAANTLRRDGIDLQALVNTSTATSVSLRREGSSRGPHNDLHETNATILGNDRCEMDADTCVHSPSVAKDNCVPVPVPVHESLKLTKKDKKLCQGIGLSVMESAPETANEKIDQIQDLNDELTDDQVAWRQGRSFDGVGENLEGYNRSCPGDRLCRMNTDCAIESSNIATKKFNLAQTHNGKKANENCEELGQQTRRSLLHSTLKTVNEKVNEVQVPATVSIGDQAGVGHGCSLDSPGENLMGARENSSGDAFNNVDMGCSVEKSDVRTKKCNPVLTPEFRKVKEALRSSILDLHDVVEDPLPDALRMAATLSTNSAKDAENNAQATENQDEADRDRCDHSGENECEVVQAKEGNTRNPTADSRPSIMERNRTAHTFEWDDDIDNVESSSEGSRKRPHLPTPKSTNISPLRRKAIRNITGRRKVKRWSSLEEHTLIDAVREYGRGNWKIILDNYGEIFEERTVVDLKDKWRNMTK